MPPKIDQQTIDTQNLYDGDGDNSEQAVSTSAVDVYHIHVVNKNTADAFLQLHDGLAASVTIGTTTPTLSFLVPAAASATQAGAIDLKFEHAPLRFRTGLIYACTTSESGNTDPTTGLVVNIRHEPPK